MDIVYGWQSSIPCGHRVVASDSEVAITINNNVKKRRKNVSVYIGSAVVKKLRLVERDRVICGIASDGKKTYLAIRRSLTEGVVVESRDGKSMRVRFSELRFREGGFGIIEPMIGAGVKLTTFSEHDGWFLFQLT